MMGTKMRHCSPLPNLSLEELVPKDNFYRRLDAMLNLSFVRRLVRECYASSGRPSVDPVVYFRLQLVMFFENIRSERQLMEVAADRSSIRWFLGYDLVPEDATGAPLEVAAGVFQHAGTFLVLLLTARSKSVATSLCGRARNKLPLIGAGGAKTVEEAVRHLGTRASPRHPSART
jgi:transposase